MFHVPHIFDLEISKLIIILYKKLRIIHCSNMGDMCASILGVLSESSSKDGCGDRGTLFKSGEGVSIPSDSALSTPGEAHEVASSTLGEKHAS